MALVLEAINLTAARLILQYDLLGQFKTRNLSIEKKAFADNAR
jgi:hypothetical protein